MTRPIPATLAVQLGAHIVNLPTAAMVGQLVRMRLPLSSVRQADTGAVVSTVGGDWVEMVMRDPAHCWDDPEVDPDGEGPDGAHCSTICPACIDSWACDWEIVLALTVDGSGDA